jgi:glycosyltransferase involved in cell wall biosynthesis
MYGRSLAGVPVKVAHVHESYGARGASGTDHSVPNTCALLEAEGVATCVLYGAELSLPASVPGRNLYHIAGMTDFSARADHRIIDRTLEALGREGADVVHFHQIDNPDLIAAVASRYPTFYFVHNHVLTCPSGLREFQREWRQCPLKGPSPACALNAYLHRCNTRRPLRVLRTIQRCVEMRSAARSLLLGVDSLFMRKSLIESGFEARRIVVTPTVTDGAAAPDDTFPMIGPARILYVGQLSEIKGLLVLLSAMTHVDPSVCLDVAGGGYDQSRLIEAVVRRGLDRRVKFHGVLPRAEVNALLQKAACSVVPSRYPEPFGLVGPEAMAAARPVIGSDIGGIPEWLEDGVTGYLVRPNDPVDLARRINELTADRGLARTMGLAGRRRWEARFEPRQHIERLLAVYNRLILGDRPDGSVA